MINSVKFRIVASLILLLMLNILIIGCQSCYAGSDFHLKLPGLCFGFSLLFLDKDYKIMINLVALVFYILNEIAFRMRTK